MKPIDQAILGMVSESPGRNESELTGDLDKACRGPTDAAGHSGGVVGAARWQGHAEQLEKPSSPQRETAGAG
jgi:hypothetical protein